MNKFLSNTEWLESGYEVPDGWCPVTLRNGQCGWAPPPAQLLAFKAALAKLQEEHGVILAHEDAHGSFLYKIDGDLWS